MSEKTCGECQITLKTKEMNSNKEQDNKKGLDNIKSQFTQKNILSVLFQNTFNRCNDMNYDDEVELNRIRWPLKDSYHNHYTQIAGTRNNDSITDKNNAKDLFNLTSQMLLIGREPIEETKLKQNEFCALNDIFGDEEKMVSEYPENPDKGGGPVELTATVKELENVNINKTQNESFDSQYISKETVQGNTMPLFVMEEYVENKADVDSNEKESFQDVLEMGRFNDDGSSCVDTDKENQSLYLVVYIESKADLECSEKEIFLSKSDDDSGEFSLTSLEEFEGKVEFGKAEKDCFVLHDCESGKHGFNELNKDSGPFILSPTNQNIDFSLENNQTFSCSCLADSSAQIDINMIENICDKNSSKKSPVSMYNASSILKNEDHIESKPCVYKDDFEKSDDKELKHEGKSLPKLTSTSPRGHSGSNNKQKGHRHGQSSRRRRNNYGGRRRSGGSDKGAGYISMDGSGSSSGGDGDGNDGKGRENRKSTGTTSNDEDDGTDDENDDEDEHKTEMNDKGASNLLQVSPVRVDKTSDKDLKYLLSDDFIKPLSPAKPESIFKWKMENEGNNLPSLPHDGNPRLFVMEHEHSRLSMIDLCDILGAMTLEDYVPRDEMFLPLNSCIGCLIHNLEQECESEETSTIDCALCPTLTDLFKHMAKCETSSSCNACIQACNIILHHSKICIQMDRQRSPFSCTDVCFKLCYNARWDIEGLFNANKAYNQMMIKKYCNKVLTLCDQDMYDQEGAKSDQTVCNLEKESKPIELPNGFRSGGHTTLSRKPSTNNRPVIPPKIIEDNEDDTDEEREEARDDSEDNKEDSALAILRQHKYGEGTEDRRSGFSDRAYSLPQGQINDQLQFNSFVNQPKGVKGVGEVVYGPLHQLRLIAGYFSKKKDEFKSTGKRPSQIYEEGVILEKYKSKFHILLTRYQLDYQWHKLTSLGRGMTGKCYLAMDKTTNYSFCAKKLNLVDYKKEEICLWSGVNHPNIVTFYGALRHSDTIFLFSEYIDGGDLGNCIKEHKERGERLSHWLALKYFQQLLNVVMYLETKSLLHEDIKADNLLLRANSFDVVLGDFGLCHLLQKPVELKDQQPVGTATHFSPEKAASLGHGFPACVWACVCVLVHMLSGQQPWHKYLKKVDYLNYTIFIKPPPLEDVPDNIRTIVKDLIAQGFTKSPEQRPSASKLLQHEAFNIVNQESETYFSTLASGLNLAGNVSNKPPKAMADHVVKGGDKQEETVSLYEISLPNNSVMEAQRSLVVENMENNDLSNSIIIASEEETKSQVMSDENDGTKIIEVEGAVGGTVEVEEEFQKTENSAIMSANKEPENNGEGDYSREEHEIYSPDIQALIEGRLPRLELLLQSDDDSVASFLLDTTNVEVPQTPQLEEYNPASITSSDHIPNLSIFEETMSLEKGGSLSSKSMKGEDCYSSGDIPSSEMFASGSETNKSDEAVVEIHTTFIQKKPRELKLDMNPQSSQRKVSNSTSSSQGSSVFFPGSATSTIEDQEKKFQEFQDILDPKPIEEIPQQQEEDKEKNKMKVDCVIQNLQRSITDISGHKLTVYGEEDEELFHVRISDKEMKLACRDLVSIFKAKLLGFGIRHFELAYKNGREFKYDSRLKLLELKVIRKPEQRSCWCASCQY